MKRVLAAMDIVTTICMAVASMVFVWMVAFGRLGGASIAAPAPAAQAGASAASAKPSSVDNVEAQHLEISVKDTAVARSATSNVNVTFIEFSDFQCPFCGRYVTETYGQVKRDFVDTGKLAYVYMNFPLESLHPLAFHSAEAAECARQQGRFWEMHDLLFGNQKALDQHGLIDKSRALGLNNSAFNTCLSGKATMKIKHDEAEGKRLGVTGTPTFFIGVMDDVNSTVRVQRRIRGAATYDTLKGVIQSVLNSTPVKS